MRTVSRVRRPAVFHLIIVRAMARLCIGFLIAPLLAAFIAGLFIALSARDIQSGLAAAFGSLVSGYLAVIFVGAPLFVIWQRRGWLSVLATCGLGGISAFLLTLAVRLFLWPGRGDTTFLVGLTNLLALTVPVGVVAGAGLWWFGVRGNIALARHSSGRASPAA